MNRTTDTPSKRNFILQQGLEPPPPETCGVQYAALLFQPRVVSLVVLIGLVFQWPMLFLVLGAVLWWSALVPRWNPFDLVYNRTVGTRPGRVPLGPAPGPRRFAQGMAGTFALAIGASLLLEWRVAAYVLEAFLFLAVLALTFTRFCLGSFIFHLIRGRVDFARRTLPWARGA